MYCQLSNLGVVHLNNKVRKRPGLLPVFFVNLPFGVAYLDGTRGVFSSQPIEQLSRERQVDGGQSADHNDRARAADGEAPIDFCHGGQPPSLMIPL